MKFKLFSFLALFVGISASSGVAFAGPEEEEWLRGQTDQLNEKWDETSYEFSDLVLKKYCPREYDLIQDTLLQLTRENRRFTRAELRVNREALLENILGHCPSAQRVTSIEYSFHEHMAVMTADIILRLEVLMSQLTLGLSFDQKRELGEMVVAAALEHDFHASKIFSILERDLDEASEVRSEYLEQLSGTKTVEHRSEDSVTPVPESGLGTPTVETSQQKPPKKGHCRICRKKLGLTPFHCKCEGEFCATHRLPEEHQCTYDHKTDGKAQLAKTLPTVRGDKMPDKL